MTRIIISTICLLCILARAALASPAPKTDKPPIPADLYYEFKPILAEENAIIDWRRAGEMVIPLTGVERQLLLYCWTPGLREPSADDLAELQNWRKQNQEALQLFDASLQKPQAQWPKRDPQKLAPELKVVSQLIRARLFDADQFAERGQVVEAVHSIEGSLNITQLGVDAAGGELLDYQISGFSRILVQGGILRLAGRKSTPVISLQKMLADLPCLDAETNSYSRILRASFSIYDYDDANYDANLIAENWSKISETDSAMLTFPEEFRHPCKILLDPSLVFQHPKPFDENADINDAIRHYRILRTNAMSAWTNRSSLLVEEVVARRAKFLHDIQPLLELVGEEPLPLNRRAAARAREAYLEIENPMGRILAISDLVGTDTRIFRFRAEREATRAVLALLIFEREKGLLPTRLSDLVGDNILQSVPIDPFSGAPICYSRERRIIWSVGEDGVNDNGSGGESRWTGPDAVWQIPELN